MSHNPKNTACEFNFSMDYSSYTPDCICPEEPDSTIEYRFSIAIPSIFDSILERGHISTREAILDFIREEIKRK